MFSIEHYQILGSGDGALYQHIRNHYKLLNFGSIGDSFQSHQLTLSVSARLAILAGTGLIGLIYLLASRVWYKLPFFTPVDSRSFTVINRKDFLELYSEDELPSNIPIDEIKGARFWWACITESTLIGLVAVTATSFVLRLVANLSCQEEAMELGFYTILAILFTARFIPSPYRPILYMTVFVSNIAALVLLFERDLWPKLLFKPSDQQILEARTGPILYIRLSLMFACFASCLLTPRLWRPVDPFSDDKASNEQEASFWSYMMTYQWIQYLVLRGFNNTLETTDLPNVPDYDKGKLWAAKWKKGDKGSSYKTLISVMRFDLLIIISCAFCMALASFVSPLAMRALLAYIEGSDKPYVTPWLFVAGLFIGPVLYSWCLQAYVFNATRLTVRVKAAFTQSLLEKTLKIRFNSESKAEPINDAKAGAKPQKLDAKDKKKADEKTAETGQQTKVGMIYNLMSSDLEQLTNARDFFLLVGLAPIEVTFAIVLLYKLMGWSSLVGVALTIVTLPLPAYLATTLSGLQREVRKATDVRIGVITEILNSIRVVKYFGWETPMQDRIREKREIELWLNFKFMCFGMGFHLIGILTPLMNMLVTFALFTKVQKQPLTASIAFTSISCFDILRSQFMWASYMSQQIIVAFVSFDRIDKFIHGRAELDEDTLKRAAATTTSAEDAEKGPYFTKATLSWNEPGAENDNGFRLSNLSVQFPYGKLTVIAGSIGSGKSSLLLGLLEEMYTLEGSVYMPRAQGVAIATQTPWLQQKTIRDNILFGTEFDQKRYDRVIESCALEQDLELFEASDLTEIGERGITLSGGQKARVSLARAVYSRAQTVLLDDILSALDAGTSKTVYDKCIRGDILEGRTVILVTHQVSLVSPAAAKIVVLDDGQVISDGPPENLQEATKVIMDEAIETDEAASEEATLASEQQTLVNGNGKPTNSKTPAKAGAKLVLEEERAIGRVPKSLVLKYVKNFGGASFILFLLGFTIVNAMTDMAETLYIGLWSDAYSKPDEPDVTWWLTMYALLLISASLMAIVNYMFWFLGQWRASRKLHELLAKSVLFSPVRFFDTTPVGRILNRFSKDIRSIDSGIGAYLRSCAGQYIDIVVKIGVLGGLIPTFLIPTIAVSIFGFIIGEMYVRASMSIKRLVSVTESPLFTHFGDTIGGIVVIRCFGVGKEFLDKNLQLIDAYTRTNQALFNLNRWMAVRIEIATALVGLFAGYLALVSNLSPGLVGFSLASSLGFTHAVLAAIRYSNALEVELNSFERVEEYLRLKQEPENTEQGKAPASWPTAGDVKVENLSVRYTVDGADVLHNISFGVKAGERVGVVGRTGAGKSSLALSLLRFTEFSSGSVSINGRDITKLNLQDLRQRVTIIPQDAVVFSGTIRTNLDPFAEKDDTELEEALQSSGLAGLEIPAANGSGGDSGIESPSTASGTVTPINGLTPRTKRITLDAPVSAGGENFSQGQRQLLALARALVRRSKLVILDEATSSTDMETDERIQETLRTNFTDSSLITIAHRLRTVMNFDRILVLDNKGNGGEVVEFDTPRTLLEDKGGILYSLAQKSGEFEALYELACKR